MGAGATGQNGALVVASKVEAFISSMFRAAIGSEAADSAVCE